MDPQFPVDADNVIAVIENENDELPSPLPTVPDIPARPLECLYFDEREMLSFDTHSQAYDISGAVRCATAPHHLTAGVMIASMYKTAALDPDIETVVLLAPMHYSSPDKLCTSLLDWNTAYGIAENDTVLTELFISKLGAAQNDEMTEYDHSASTHIPFIKRYLPQAKVAVLLVSPNAGERFPENAAALLTEMSETKRCFFAFSIDFSHYLPPELAARHDKETRTAVLAGDTDRIERFTNDNTDTPFCLSTFVRLAALLGCTVTEADNSDTSRIPGSLPYSPVLYPDGVTSYFVFTAKKNG